MKRSFSAFTLIELLVVIAIIAILAAILFPVFAQARAAARKANCLSNMKQIAMGILMYVQDYDEAGVPKRAFTDPSAWFTGREIIWKDLVLPYIKSGGRPYDGGRTYTTPGDGGIFRCMENSAAWSAATVVYWGGWGPGVPGDETSRYPRSYALNNHAGHNEANREGAFWPDFANGVFTPGNLSLIQQPASTIMLAETRMFFPEIWGTAMGYACTLDGIPVGGVPTGCIQGHKSGMTNFAFFDGHVKTIRLQRSVSEDLWDAFAPNTDWGGGYTGAQAQQDVLNAINSLQEWTTGI